MKKIYLFAVVTLVFGYSTIQQAKADEEAEFLGGYYGGKLGVNHTNATGAINAPSESTVSYIVQGGYIQGGYNEKFGVGVVGIGGYADLHGYERHSNGIAYGGHAYGLDVKLALPVSSWLPYAKIGYGYSAGTHDLRDVRQYGFNKTIGGEYKLDIHWSAVVEYKINHFQKDSTSLENQTFMFGFNYYINEPKVAAPEPEIDLTNEPPPEAVPDAPPDFAPPP